MPAIVRRTSTKVVNGRVTRKNRSDRSEVGDCVIRNFPAGRGYRHVVSPKQLQDFLEIVPGWERQSYRLGSISLIGAKSDYFGYFTQDEYDKTSMIALCAWPKKLWVELSPWFVRNHREIFENLGIAYDLQVRPVLVKFNVAQARAFMLLHVFMHELGHHRDWLRRRGYWLPGTEAFAEDFAISYWDILFPLYCERFGDPRSRKAGIDEQKMAISRWTQVI